MKVTTRRLNRATLDRQLLLRRERLAVVDAVRHVTALQAQSPASPYLALWNRLDPFDPADLDAAFADRTVVKATLVRITLHAVAADDYPAFHAAMLPTLRASRLYDRRFRSTGLTVAELDALLPHVVEFAARARTKADFNALLAERLGAEPDQHVWWALRTFAALHHAPTGAPWTFGWSPSYIAAPPSSVDHEQAVAHLVRRYLSAFGPATVADVGQFSLLSRATIRAALRTLDVRTYEGPDGTELYDTADGPALPDEDTPAPPRLLGMWDSILLAYADRSRTIPPEYRKVVCRANGDVLPTLLVDGLVAGVWRATGDGIEATAFHPLSDQAWHGLATEAGALMALLADRDPRPYGRYDHWWAKLPAGEVRVLTG